ncbi:hypothetical protein D3C75_1005630 [compost metagenome]
MLLEVDQRPVQIAHRPVCADPHMIYSGKPDDIFDMIQHMVNRRMVRIPVNKPRHGKNPDHPAGLSDSEDLLIALAAHMRINGFHTGVRGNHGCPGNAAGIQRGLLTAVPGIDDHAQLVHTVDEPDPEIRQSAIRLLCTA